MIRRLLYVAFFLEVGLLLIVLPWSGFWERNYFAAVWPALRAFLTNNFVRGAISGLGGVNVFSGFAELMTLFAAREPRHVSLTRPSRETSAYGSGRDAQVDP
jgi:hypothetical protein